jgi:putative ABC transport system permease protein
VGRVLKGALAHKLRLIHTAFAAALAVSLVAGTFVLTDTVNASFTQATTASPSDVDVIVRSASQFSADGNSLPERESVPPTLVDTVRSVPGVRAAWGLVWGYAQLVDKEGKAIAPQGLPTIGTSWSPSDGLEAGRAPTESGEVVIDSATAREHHFSLGDRIKVLFQGAVEEFTIRGIRAASDYIAATLATFDVRTAQRLLGREDRFDAIAVHAAPDVTADVLRARVTAVLPDGYQAVTNDQAAREAKKSWTNALGFVTTGLLVFAAIALLVGGFIIFNTFSILVAQRTRDLGLLRALGASRAQLMASVLAESLAVGSLASALGVLLGFGAARGLLALMRGIGLEVASTSVVFVPRTAAAGLLCGVMVTAVAAVLPARRATRVAPVEGMAGQDGHRAHARRRQAAAGTLVTGVGVLSVVVGLSSGVLPAGVAVGAGAAGVLLGLALLTPLLATPAARVLGAPLVALLGEPGRLGRENAMRHPRRTAVTAAALTIGIALVGVVGIVAASMKASAGKAVDETLRADFVIKATGSPGLSGGIPTAVAARLRQTPGVEVVSQFRAGQWGLRGRAETVLAVDPATVARVHRLDPASLAATERLTDRTVVVRDTVAARHGWRIGDEVPMTFARTGSQRLRLVDTFSATAVSSDYVVSLRTFEANFAQQLDAEVRLRLAPGIPAGAARGRIEQALTGFPNVELMNRAELLAAQKQQVNRVLLPVTALIALSVVIALLGIANTLALSIHERTREIGLLRAIGMARGQLRSMIRSEAVIIATLGAVLGAAVAVFFGWTLVSVLHPAGVTEFVLPLGQLGGWVLAAAAAGLLAGLLPARRAARLDVLDALAGD